jgi:hypothetical protein
VITEGKQNLRPGGKVQVSEGAPGGKAGAGKQKGKAS